MFRELAHEIIPRDSFAMEQTAQRRAARFGVFEADFDRLHLTKNELRIRLQNQPFRILAILLERPGQIVTRAELKQELWPGDAFVEFDAGLNTAIKKLRAALNDSADNSRFVETKPRVGYRFVALVSVPIPTEASAVSPVSGVQSTGDPSEPANVISAAGAANPSENSATDLGLTPPADCGLRDRKPA